MYVQCIRFECRQQTEQIEQNLNIQSQLVNDFIIHVVVSLPLTAIFRDGKCEFIDNIYLDGQIAIPSQY